LARGYLFEITCTTAGKAHQEEIDSNQEGVPRERVHDRVDGSLDIEKPLDYPSYGRCSGKGRTADSKNWIRPCSTHEHQRRQNGCDHQHLHRFDA
jgi:hypothetical protein